MQSLDIENIRQVLAKKLDEICQGEGYFQTDIEALNFYREVNPTEFLSTVYEPSLCVILQGAKAVGLDEELYEYNPSTYLLASVHMPARVRITEASKEVPYVSLKITFSIEQVFELLKEIPITSKLSTHEGRGLYFGKMETTLLEPIFRLVRLLESPKDITILSPLIIKEILYIVMCDKGGDFIRRFVMEGNATQQVVKVITKIKDDFRSTLNIRELAKSIGMSESSLYHNFKKVTTMSPLQFQKTLRLQEARHKLMMYDDIEASQVAFDVGYESSSQFSREYARMYGLPPKTDIRRMRGDC